MDDKKMDFSCQGIQEGGVALLDKDGSAVGVIFKEEDARRVVACLNACEGISTEILEGNVLPVVFEPDTTANNLRLLVDACERMQRKADVFDSMIGEEMGVGIDDWREFVDAVAAARQALDAKKGGAA